jgi:uncharacterized protein
MSAGVVTGAVLLGVAAGVLSGMFGIGGGTLFVPTLIGLGLTPHHAAATSLLAIVPTALVGVWRQRRYGNLRARAALLLGLASIAGVEAGVRISIALPEHTLRRLFAIFLLAVAVQLVYRERSQAKRYPQSP